eukprot:1186288-Alexandrium_andersonii.AAC.1
MSYDLNLEELGWLPLLLWPRAVPSGAAFEFQGGAPENSLISSAEPWSQLSELVFGRLALRSE